VTAAEKEAHDKVVARKEQARAAASAAVEKVIRKSIPPATLLLKNGAPLRRKSLPT